MPTLLDTIDLLEDDEQTIKNKLAKAMGIPIVVKKGGPTSGNFGHAGRPGKVGGSTKGSSKFAAGKAPFGGELMPKDYEMFSLQRAWKGGETYKPLMYFMDKGLNTISSNYGDKYVNEEYTPESIDNMISEAQSIDNVNMGGIWADTYLVNNNIRGTVKDDIIKGLSVQTGVDYQTINSIIEQWANTSNGESYASLSLQQAAAEEFGVELSDWQQKKLDMFEPLVPYSKLMGDIAQERYSTFQKLDKIIQDKYPNLSKKDILEVSREIQLRSWDLKSDKTWILTGIGDKAIDIGQPEFIEASKHLNYLREASNATRKKMAKVASERGIMGFDSKNYVPITDRATERKVLRAIYDNTQKELGDAGIDEVVLYRGIKNSTGHIKTGEGKIADYHGNALESWTIHPDVARDFSFGSGVIVAIKVPRRNVFSTARTGTGCLVEGEFVLLDNQPGSQVRVWYNGKDWYKDTGLPNPEYETDEEFAMVKKGGPTSGNFGHAGRPGKVGGSAPDKTVGDLITEKPKFGIGDYVQAPSGKIGLIMTIGDKVVRIKWGGDEYSTPTRVDQLKLFKKGISPEELHAQSENDKDVYFASWDNAKLPNNIKTYMKDQIWQAMHESEDFRLILEDATGEFVTTENVEAMSKMQDEETKQWLEDMRPFIRVPEEVLGKILTDGRFKSQYETGTSGGWYDENNSTRRRVEKEIFGYETMGTPDEERPIYGYLSDNDQGPSSVSHYGNVTIELYDNVLDEATFTNYDSLDMAEEGITVLPSPVRHPSWLSMAKNSDYDAGIYTGKPSGGNYDYTEVQFHGKLHANSIKSIHMKLYDMEGVTPPKEYADNMINTYKDRYPDIDWHVTIVKPDATGNLQEEVYKGGPGSGNFDHEGRPGLVGGSSTNDKLPGEVDSLKDLKWYANWGTGYFVFNDERIIDARGLAHIDFLDQNPETAKAFGFTDKEYSDFHMWNNVGDTDSFNKAYKLMSDVMKRNNWVRIRNMGKDIAIQTGSFDKATLRKLQRMFDKKKIESEPGMGAWAMVTWDIGGKQSVRVRLGDFLRAKYVIEKDAYTVELKEAIVVKGGPTSGNFGHQGRPGLVGGSTTSKYSKYSKALNEAPLGKASDPAAKKWRKKYQDLYDNDPEFRALVGTISCYTQGGFKSVREFAKYAVTEEIDPKDDSMYPTWIKDNFSMKILGPFMGDVKNYFNDKSKAETVSEMQESYTEPGYSATKAAALLQAAIADAEPLDYPIYRGEWSVIEPKYDKKDEKGYTVYEPSVPLPEVGSDIDILGTSSFTADKEIADQFANRSAKGVQSKGLYWTTDKILHYKVLPGAKGVNASPLSIWDQKEVITSGRFRVKSVKQNGVENIQMKKGDRYSRSKQVPIYEIELEQVGVWEVDPDKFSGEVKYQYEH